MQGVERSFAIDDDLISWQDARNEQTLRWVIERPVRERSRELNKAREAYSRKLLERRLPGFLHRLLDHPRALAALYRVIPRWRPLLTVVMLEMTTTADAACQASERWLQEQEARGRDVSGGHVFTYTDASGLPAEVYGP